MAPKLVMVLLLWSSMAWAAPTMTVTPASVALNGTVTVTMAGGSGSATDWIGLYPVGAASGDILQWSWLNGSHTQPEVGLTGATITALMPTLGTFEFRLYDVGYTKLAVSSPVTVGAVAPPPVILPPPVPTGTPPTLTMTPSQLVTVKVAGGPATQMDWLGLFPVGAADDQWINWYRLTGTKYAPSKGMAAGGAMFILPATGGPFEVRFFQGTGYGKKIATSTAFGGTLTITVEAAVPEGTEFKHWSGDPRCTAVPMILTSDLTCTATFAP